MRWQPVMLAVLLAIRAGDAQEPDPPAVAPGTAAEAARKSLEACRARDAGALKALAARDDPDPWLVAEELCSLGEREAAEAFARAAPRRDVAGLPEYIASSGKESDAAARRAIEAANAALRKGDAEAALATIEAAGAGGSGVVSVRLLFGRGHALRALRRALPSAEAFSEAGLAAERIGWLARAALAFYESGQSASRLDPRRTLSEWERYLALSRRRERAADVADALLCVGMVHRWVGDYPEASARQTEALEAFTALGDREGIGRSLGEIGSIHSQTGDFDRALDAYRRSQAIAEELGDAEAIASRLGNIALVLMRKGESREALALFGRARELQEARGDEAALAVTLVNAAGAHMDLGDETAALDCFERALALAVSTGYRSCEFQAILGLALVHERRGDLRRALSLQEQALARMEEFGDKHGAASALVNLGGLWMEFGDLERALDYTRRGLAAKEAIGDRDGAATAMENLAGLHEARGELEAARELHRRAYEASEAMGNGPGMVLGLIGMAHGHAGRGEFAEAHECLERALGLARDGNQPVLAGAILRRVGDVCHEQGDLRRSLDAYLRSAELLAANGDREGSARSLVRAGSVHQRLGSFAAALDCCRKGLRIGEESGNRSLAAQALIELARVHEGRGAVAEALTCAERALLLHRQVGGRLGIASAMTVLGTLQAGLGAHAKAIGWHEEARKAYEEVRSRSGMAGALVSIGGGHRALGDLPRALEFTMRGLELAREIGHAQWEVSALGALSAIESDLGHHEKSLAYDLAALEWQRKHGNRAGEVMSLVGVGLEEVRLGRLAEGLAHHEEALRLATELGAAAPEIDALGALAVTLCRLDRPRDAAAHVRRAIDRLPLLVGGLGEEEGAQARTRWIAVAEVGFAASLMLGDPAEASYFVESGRAGSLLESLGGRSSMEEAVVLPEEERRAETDARALVVAAEARLDQAMRRGDRAEVGVARVSLKEAESKLLDAIAASRRAVRSQARVAYPKADGLDAIRGRLAEGDALVSYLFVTESHVRKEGFALVVTREEARLAALGETAAIEEAALALVPPEPSRDVSRGIEALRSRVIDPLGLGAHVRRVLLSPSGVLSQVPFGLLLPGREVAYVPSGTALGVLLADRATRGRELLALGDPDYGVESAGDPASPGGRRLEPLPGTRAEALAIGGTVLVGADASAPRLLAAIGREPRWRAVHLACHGLVDPDRPMLSSLELSGSRLTVPDVLRARIPADLVVLSACETGRGKVYGAEGLVGFTSAFLFAGSPRVIVSLWKVDDEATRALMVKFYELWNPKEGGSGLPAAAALRRAQEFVAGHEKWRHPHYWAAWQLWGLAD